MTYRNINVNGTDYKYVIGKTYIKVVGIGSILKYRVGTPAGITYKTYLEWMKLSDSELQEKTKGHRVQTGPGDVKKFILNPDGNIPLLEPFRCNGYRYIHEESGRVQDDVRLRSDPFDGEIYRKLNFSFYCQECHDERAMDI